MMRTTICALAVLLSANAFAEEKKAAAGDKKPDMAAMMAAMEKAATPGPEHKALADQVGTWTAKSKMWMEPGKPPTEAQGTEEVKSVLGGRFIELHFNGNMMGKPFEGMGHEGYDNMKKKWVMTWMDSMGTMIIYAEGTGDAKTRTFIGEETMPNGAKRPFRWVMKVESPTKHTMEMYAPGMDGKEAKQMEIVYTKAGSAK
jgi:Protein of unknown function (DUF1579)